MARKGLKPKRYMRTSPRAGVKIEETETRVSKIASISYKPGGEGAKFEMTLRSVDHEQPPDKQCDDANSLQNSQNEKNRKRQT